MKKTLFLVACICLLISSCEIVYAQQPTTVSVTRNGIRRTAIAVYPESLKVFMPVGLPSYSEDSLRRVGEMMTQNDTLKAKASDGIFRIQMKVGTSGQAPVSNGRVLIPTSIATLELGGRKSLPFVWKESISGADSTRVDIYEIRGTGVIDSVKAIQVGASAVTIMLVKDSLGTRRDCYSSNQTVNTTTTTLSGLVFSNLSTGFRFFIAVRTITGTMTWLKVQVFFHITS